MAVDVTARGSALELGVARKLFDVGAGVIENQLAASMDGQRFFFRTPKPGTRPPSITVVVNWLAGVKR